MSNFNQSLSDDEKAALSNLAAALKPFYKLRATMPLQYITAFLLVALKEGQTVTELARGAGTSQSLMTRHLADLSQSNRHHKDGYDLIEGSTDPMDRRAKRQRLTAKGQRLVGHLLGALAR
jgi:DNA-binding MarR family transcriptional regulator